MNDSLHSFSESKWEWVQSQINGLAQKLKPLLDNRGIDLVTFSVSYDMEKGCTPEHVMNVLQTTTPTGGTDLGDPLATVFRDYQASLRERPLFVAVMTDGMPNHGPDVQAVIMEAARAMRSPNEIRLVFLEIGEEFEGWSTIKVWGDNLAGAGYRIIDSVRFSELAKVGLAQKLVEVVRNSEITPSVPSR